MATSPSARLIALSINTEDKVEPKATVTTRSKEFILDSVRLPLTRRSTMVPA